MEMSSSISGEISEDQDKDWIIDIHEDLERDPECCIYRVPKRIRKVNEAAYTPQVISIGPFHYGKKELELMEKQKGRYVSAFFKRTTREKFKEVYAFINEREKQIQKCYSETCNLESRAYIKMILRDAIFIIELLLRDYDDDDEDDEDFFLRVPAEKYALKLDLQLLENQLPYFLLEGLYKLVVSSPSFVDLCSSFFEDLMFYKVPEETVFKHFTDLQRASLVESYPKQKRHNHHYADYLPCATKLRESGVKFRRAPKREHKLMIKFEEGQLIIPSLNVYHETDTIFRNIMALEQCLYPRRTLVCAYVLLLDFLIEDKRDAQLLVDEGIICNWMGDNKALASLFNKLCNEIPLVGNHYKNIYEDVNKFHDNKYNQNKAKLKRVYFSDIWRGTATVAATVLLILTFTQTMYSVTHLK